MDYSPVYTVWEVIKTDHSPVYKIWEVIQKEHSPVYTVWEVIQTDHSPFTQYEKSFKHIIHRFTQYEKSSMSSFTGLHLKKVIEELTDIRRQSRAGIGKKPAFYFLNLTRIIKL